MSSGVSGAPSGQVASRRGTSLALSAGVTVAAACFAVSLLLEVAGLEPGGGAMTDLGVLLAGLLAPTPWAWAAAGAYALVATPVAGLLVTAWEYRRAGDRRTVLLAVAVLAVLGVSALVAILR